MRIPASSQAEVGQQEEQRSIQSPRIPGFRILKGSYAFFIPRDSESATTLGDIDDQSSAGSFSKTISLVPSPAFRSSKLAASPSISEVAESALATTRITPRLGSMVV